MSGFTSFTSGTSDWVASAAGTTGTTISTSDWGSFGWQGSPTKVATPAWYVCDECGFIDTVTHNHPHSGKWSVYPSLQEAQLSLTRPRPNIKQIKKQIKKKESRMALSDKLSELKLAEPEKTLHKHGVIDRSGRLTEEGETVVISYAFGLIKDALVADLAALDAAKTADKAS